MPNDQWTEEDVERIQCNPAYAGVGGFEPMISREEWIAVATRKLRKGSPKHFLNALLDAIDAHFTINTENPPIGYDILESESDVKAWKEGQDRKMVSRYDEAYLLDVIREETLDGKLKWTANIDKGDDGEGHEYSFAEFCCENVGGLSVKLDKTYHPGENEPFTGFEIHWPFLHDKYSEEALFPADGTVFRHPNGETAFERLWAVLVVLDEGMSQKLSHLEQVLTWKPSKIAERDTQGHRVAISMDYITAQNVQYQLAAFRIKFGREPKGDDPLFFDPDADEPREMPPEKMKRIFDDMIVALAKSGMDPAAVHATAVTRLLVTEMNVDVLKETNPEGLAAWYAAVDEYEKTHKNEA
jgi:hypothetical protein